MSNSLRKMREISCLQQHVEMYEKQKMNYAIKAGKSSGNWNGGLPQKTFAFRDLNNSEYMVNPGSSLDTKAMLKETLSRSINIHLKESC